MTANNSSVEASCFLWKSQFFKVSKIYLWMGMFDIC